MIYPNIWYTVLLRNDAVILKSEVHWLPGSRAPSMVRSHGLAHEKRQKSLKRTCLRKWRSTRGKYGLCPLPPAWTIHVVLREASVVAWALGWKPSARMVKTKMGGYGYWWFHGPAAQARPTHLQTSCTRKKLTLTYLSQSSMISVSHTQLSSADTWTGRVCF